MGKGIGTFTMTPRLKPSKAISLRFYMDENITDRDKIISPEERLL